MQGGDDLRLASYRLQAMRLRRRRYFRISSADLRRAVIFSADAEQLGRGVNVSAGCVQGLLDNNDLQRSCHGDDTRAKRRTASVSARYGSHPTRLLAQLRAH